jgi:hypothetical protein
MKVARLRTRRQHRGRLILVLRAGQQLGRVKTDPRDALTLARLLAMPLTVIGIFVVGVSQ